MEKTEMMKRYEQETGEILDIDHLSADANGSWYGYIDELEAKANISDEAIKAFQEIIRNQCDEISALKEKAEAYDRLMSGGRKTLKEWANIFGKPVVINVSRVVFVYENVPRICCGVWCGQFVCSLSHDLSDFSGDWKDSLTMPDGWEEK